MFAFRRSSEYKIVAPLVKQIAADTAVTYIVGDALVITSNKAAKASGATTPTYICAEDATGKAVISAYPVDDKSEYETTASGTVTVGSKYTIADTADSITTTTTGGVATVTGVAGTRVFVKFE